MTLEPLLVDQFPFGGVTDDKRDVARDRRVQSKSRRFNLRVWLLTLETFWTGPTPLGFERSFCGYAPDLRHRHCVQSCLGSKGHGQSAATSRTSRSSAANRP